jgi:hypothetical protein
MAVSFTQAGEYITPQVDGETYLGLGGDDTYVLSPFSVEPDATIIITDTEGDNKIQLVGGLEIVSSEIYNNFLQLTLNNGANIQITGAASFVFDVGGNYTTGVEGIQQDYATFVTETLGAENVPEPGEDPIVIDEPVVIGDDPPVGDTFTLAEAVALGEDLPEEYNIEDEAANLFDNGAFATDAEVILDGAATVEVTDGITVAQYELVDGLATFDTANLTYDLADTFETLYANQDVVDGAGSYELTDAEGTDFGRITEEEETFIQAADNYEEGYWEYNLPVEGNSFTFIAADAILTNDLSVNVDPEDTFLTDADDTINALTFLGNNVYVEDISQDDADVLNATVGAAITPTIINIEEIEVRSTANAASLDFGAIEGAQLVTLTGTRDFDALNFVQDGSVEAVLTTNQTFTVTGNDAAAATDSYKLSVEGSTGTTGGFTITAGAGAGAVGEIDLESNGSAKNIITLDTAAGNYTGVTNLNLMGTADLDITTDFLATTEIDATGLGGVLGLNLKGAAINAAANDLAENVDGEVDILTLTDFGDNAGNLVETADIEGLTEVRLSSTNTSDQAIDVGVADGVEVSLVQADGGAGENVVIVVDGADTDNDADLTYNVGGAAAVVAGTLTAANIQNLTINSVGSAANSITGATTNVLENLMVTADQDFTATSFSVFDGTDTTTDIFNIMTAGDSDIALGTITTDSEVNGVVLENSGEGDRTFTLDDAGELKNATRGEGVTVEGDGTGDVVITDAQATPGTIINALAVDGSDYAGDLYLATAAGAQAIDADDFTGVAGILLTGTYNQTISNLAANTTVITTSATDTLIGITNKTGVTEQDFLMKRAADGTQTVTTFTANSVTTLNITTDDENQTAGTFDAHTITTLNATKLVTLNIDAAEDAPFVLGGGAYTTRDGVAGSRDFYVNIEGDGAATLTTGLTSGDGIDTIEINADGEGARNLGAISTTDMSNGGSVTVTGDSDVTITNIIDTGATSISYNLNSDGDITVEDMNVDIVAGQTVTINSESSDGEGENEITDAVNIAFLTAGASTLEITGNQDLVIGTIGTAGTYLGLGALDGDENTLDASAFTGALTVGLTRDPTASASSDTQTVKIGTGDTEITNNIVGVPRIYSVLPEIIDNSPTFHYSLPYYGNANFNNYGLYLVAVTGQKSSP